MSKYLNIETAGKLINFAGVASEDSQFMKNLGDLQLKGAVALFNKIADHGIGYIADEVGMGKTYVALGVVTLMRYFNPSLRVLYIVPKQNLITKWMYTDYPNFLGNNFLVSDYRVKCDDNVSAAKGTECKNLVDLIEKSSTGYYADFFIKGSAFSFPIESGEDACEKELDKLKRLLPSFNIAYNREIHNKKNVKKLYADTINKILPDFDLIVVDEAHNYRKSQESSSRNMVLSRILGTFQEGEEKLSKRVKRVRNALLLSATPFESEVDELRNQLRIFGKEEVLSDFSEEEKFKVLSKFMVRRLNTLTVNGEECTRNMYRREYRKEAAIEIKDTATKLVVALMQKKVGELLHEMKGQYQTGMLASFESYIPSTRNIDVEFDGDQEEKNCAKDTSIIRVISDSYVKKFNKPALPHPKMDETVNKFFSKAFEDNKKQIIFVRRVQSVTDLKLKFDAKYDEWLKEYINRHLNNNSEALASFNSLMDQFSTAKNKDMLDRLVEDAAENDESDEDVNTDNSTFLNFFFRGRKTPKIAGEKPQIKTFKKYLTDKTEKSGLKDYLLVDGTFSGRFFAEIEECVFGKVLDIKGEDKNKNLFIRELYYSLLRLGHGLVDLYIAYLNGGDWVGQVVAILKAQECRKDPFSTYQQIKDCYENIDIIIKTNFNDYEKHIDDIRRYIVRKLNPMEPIVGASGHGGNDKTLTALKFRMPGYPMVLISTDVLQEGEDLHTFCDSIVHYGLSSNPIALEQKTGRVDRVGSMAQRNLARLAEYSASILNEIIEQAGVKVAFPFIKESFEYFQVRNLSQRLNRFLASLHKYEVQNYDSREDITNVEDGISCGDEIEELIKSKLTSPFDISEKEITALTPVFDFEEPKNSVHKYIRGLIKKIGLSEKEYSLTPSANPGEWMITIISNPEIDEVVDYGRHEDLLAQLVKIGARGYHRALLKKYEEKDHRITVCFNSQMMVGDGEITQEEEIKELIERSKSGRLNSSAKPVVLASLYLKAIEQYPLDKRQRFIRNHSVVTKYENDSIIFQFNGGCLEFPFERKQLVHLFQKEGYIVFQSKCFNLEKWTGNPDRDKLLVKYTIERNKEIDIVEFIVTEDRFIEGRIVHPIKNMQPKEFLFNAYILACEADQLEMVLSDLEKDQF